jgi:hypothetical protein
VVLFDAQGKRVDRPPLEVKEGYVSAVALTPSGQIVAGYGFQGAGGLVLLDAGGKRARTAVAALPEGFLTSVALGPNGQIVAGCTDRGNPGILGAGGGLFRFNAKGEQLRTPTMKIAEGNVLSVAVDDDGRIAAGYGIRKPDGSLGSGGVVLFAANGQRLPTSPMVVKEGGVTSVAFGSKHQIAAGYTGSGAGGPKGGVAVFDTQGQPADSAVRGVEDGYVMSVAFGPKDQVAAGYASGGKRNSGGIAIFNALGAPVEVLEVPEGIVRSVAFDAGGRIAAGYGDDTFESGCAGGVVLFDSHRQPIAPSPFEVVNQGCVWSVAFGPDNWLAAGYGYVGMQNQPGDIVGGVVLFDARLGRLTPGLFELKQAPVRSVAFDATGRIAAACSPVNALGGVVVLDADLRSWLRKVARVANRNLTVAEWKQYVRDTPYRRTIRTLDFPDDFNDLPKGNASARKSGRYPIRKRKKVLTPHFRVPVPNVGAYQVGSAGWSRVVAEAPSRLPTMSLVQRRRHLAY